MSCYGEIRQIASHGQQKCENKCEFCLLRYVPDAVRNEYVHVGVILREQESRRVELRFTRDWRRVRCLDPDADTALLEGMESELRRRLQAERSAGSDADARGVAFAQRTNDRGQAYLAESLPRALNS